MKYLDAVFSGLLFLSATGFADTAISQPVKERTMIIMQISGEQFKIVLNENAAAEAFAKSLPLRMDMTELNGNEKFADLPHSLPSSPLRPGRLHAGDLMLYGDKTVVLFYETFVSNYLYTPLGKVQHPDSLPDLKGVERLDVLFTGR